MRSSDSLKPGLSDHPIKKTEKQFYSYFSLECPHDERHIGKIENLKMKKVMIKSIKMYQRYISPMKGTKCPYIPSCSQYGLEAVEKYGALKGGALAAWRILRCNPFSSGGFDPVP